MAGRSLARAIAAIGFSIAAVGATSAFAQNYEGPGVLRAGVFLQGTLADMRSSTYDPTGALVNSGSGSISSVGGGMTFGYDYRIGNMFVGVEGDGAFTNGESSIGGQKFTNDSMMTARGRLGAYIRPNIMLYATAGYAGSAMSWRRPDNPTTSASLKRDAILSGWTAGGGAELDLPGYTLFAEYLYADFGSWNFNDFAGNTIKANIDDNIFRIGAKFKIGYDFYPF